MSRSILPVTVVLPVLNEAQSSPALLEALAGQTCQPAEIIFCDGGSTDATRDLIEGWWAKYAWEGTALRLLERPGALPGDGRNNGIRAATQAWIAFLDAGIAPEPDWLEGLFACVRRNGGRAAFGLCEFSADAPVQRALCALSNGYMSVVPVIPASMFHRDVFGEVGLFREDLRTAEDLLWVREYERRFGPRPVCTEARVRYRQFPASLSDAFSKWRIAELNGVRAGLRGSQHVVYIAAMPLLLLLAAFSSAAALVAVITYLLLRGGVDPIRRSRERRWWNGCGRAFFIAFGAAACIDAAKWIGIVQGSLEKLRPPPHPAR